MRTIAIFMAVAALAATTRVGRAEQGAFRADIDKLTQQNTDFRRVLFTGPSLQIVAMSLREREDIGEEVHDVDQCFFFVNGEAEVVVKGKPARMPPDSVLCVPGGTRHNIRNAGGRPLKLYTLYAPPQHPARTVHHTKADAERAEKSGDRKPKK